MCVREDGANLSFDDHSQQFCTTQRGGREGEVEGGEREREGSGSGGHTACPLLSSPPMPVPREQVPVPGHFPCAVSSHACK